MITHNSLSTHAASPYGAQQEIRIPKVTASVVKDGDPGGAGCATMSPMTTATPTASPRRRVGSVLPVVLVVAVVGIVGIGPYSKVELGYYAVILAIIGVFQNTATLPDGIAVITGNVVAQLIVVVVCVLGLRDAVADAPLRRERLWLLPLML